ncbi:MAG TPA: GTP cyclohydrolase I FolE [Gemmatimonadales bacterium]|nr:GTP cyclohydrolase I FolE [Gemmatimonadales bacterium]
MSAVLSPLGGHSSRPVRTLVHRRALVAARVRDLLLALNLDLSDPNLAGTPERMSRSFEELLSGLRDDNAPELTTFPHEGSGNEPVLVTGIAFHSLCAHHLLPFFGVAHVAYLPEARVVGLSKLARVVEFFARRPQLQERLTDQIAEYLDEKLGPGAVYVTIEARHLCMEMRGVAKPGAQTVTTATRGPRVDASFRSQVSAQLTRASQRGVP